MEAGEKLVTLEADASKAVFEAQADFAEQSDVDLLPLLPAHDELEHGISTPSMTQAELLALEIIEAGLDIDALEELVNLKYAEAATH